MTAIPEPMPTAEDLYAARAAFESASPTGRRFGLAEIYRYLHGPSASLSAEEQALLFKDRKLAAAFRRIKAELALFEMPTLAAASDGAVTERTFAGHTIRVHASRVPGQVYAMFAFQGAGRPRRLILQGRDGQLVDRDLPAADAEGNLVIILEEARPADRAFLALLMDPQATGTFLP